MTAVLLGLFALQDGVPADLLEYQPNGPLEGVLQLSPGAGFQSLVTRWSERMKQHYPDLRGGKLDSNVPAPPQALISRACPMGILPRRWSRSELEEFRFKWGNLPTEVVVGADAISVVVHPQNPIRGLLLEEIDSIFSSTRRRGVRLVRTWGDLGFEGEFKNQPIALHGMGKDSPIRSFFQEKALRGGLLLREVKEHSDTDALLQAVEEDPFSIGYVRSSVRPDRCRVVPLRTSGSGPGVEPQVDSILSFSYPLAWRVYISVRRDPGASPDSVVGEFLRMILSRDGQEILAGEGLIPLTGRMARKELEKLQ